MYYYKYSKYQKDNKLKVRGNFLKEMRVKKYV